MNKVNKEHQTLKLKDGRVLGFAEYGDPKGKPIFYFHGWPGSRLRIKAITDDAKMAHARLISVDRPGHGLSHFQHNRELLDWPNDVIELADYLKLQKFAVLGVSGGGPYAAVMAYMFPKRLTNVGIVVGVGPTEIPGILTKKPLLFRIGWVQYAKHPILAYIGAYINFISAKYLPLSLAPFQTKSDRALIDLIKESRTSFVEAFSQGKKGPARDLYIYANKWGFNVRDIKANVYLWYGGEDKTIPLSMGEYYYDNIENSEMKVYPHEGHMVSVSHAKEIFETLV